MTMQPDDPRLTAYALDELSDEERAEVQRELKDSPQVRAELSAIRQTAELLARELAVEQAPALTEEERGRITSAARQHVSSEGATVGLPSSAGANLLDGDANLDSTQSQSDGIVKPGASAPGIIAPVPNESPAGATSNAAPGAVAPLGLEVRISDRSPGADAPGYTPSPVPGDCESMIEGNVNASPSEKSNDSKDLANENTLAQPSKWKPARRRFLVVSSVAASWIVVAVSAYLIGASDPDRVTTENEMSHISTAFRRNVQFHKGGSNDDYRERLRSELSANKSNSSRRDISQLDVIVSSDESHTVGLEPQGNFTSEPTPAKWGYAGKSVQAGDYLASGSDASGVWPSGDYDVPATDESPMYSLTAKGWHRLKEERQRLERFDVDADRDGVLDLATVLHPLPGPDPRFNTEAYDRIVENSYQDVTQYPLSTFSIDVDTASYANVRRMLNSGRLPPPGAVRIEEFVNYFDYDYAPPDGAEPFAVRAEVAACPWRPSHRLVRIGIKGRQIAVDQRPLSNLVFLLDVSGSMNDPAKLPLVKQGLRMLVERLTENDRVAIVTYAGDSGLALDSTSGADKQKILTAIDQLQPGGSTNGAGGIELAYQIAEQYRIADGVNRVILATDGDFNIGITDQSQLVKMIEDKATGGVFLSVLGFGMGNLKDSTLEKLADQGNGNYAYIDTLSEANKVLVRQMDGTLVTIAKDVKIQLEFNPVKVAAYRLIGYENRVLAKEEFNDDTVDAGEIGAGHTVTALYEVVPAGKETDLETPAVDDLEYQVKTHPTDAAKESPNLLTLKLRYKDPSGQESKLLRFPVADSDQRFGQSDGDFQFASAVAAFGMLLRNSAYRGEANYDAVLEYATGGLGADVHGYRAEFVELVQAARELNRRQTEDSGSP